MLESKFPYPNSKVRGGTFFTMVIFVMLLVSSALMYYYFQRTRALEREVMALKSGEPMENDGDGFWSFLPWNKQSEMTAASPPVAVATPAPAPEVEPAPTPASTETATYDGLPPTGAASTPRPVADNQPEVSAGNDIPAYSGLTLTEDPEQAPDILPPADAPEPESTEGDETVQQTGELEEEVPAGEVNSMYDAPPQVRVRAPQRD